MTPTPLLAVIASAVALPLASEDAENQDAAKPFVIRVVDSETGRGVPLVELRTTNAITLFTDNVGVVAFDEPGLLGRRVYFHVRSHGYEMAADGFGNRGVALDTAPGGHATVKLPRKNIAERLYRITGQGLYHHSLRAGLPVPLEKPALNAGVMGQDSAGAVVHRGRVRWFWGDTSLPGYPLGHFGTATATSRLPARGGLEPEVGIDLAYAVDERGYSRPTFDLDEPGVVWVHSPFVLEDPDGEEQILAQYERRKGLEARLELGIALFDDEAERFRPVQRLPLDEERHPFGQAFRHTVDGRDYLYFALPYPLLRVPAEWDAVLDPERYEAFTCLEAGEPYRREAPAIARGDDGKPEYRWRRAALPVLPERQDELVRAGHLAPDEAWIRTADAETGERVHLHRGSVRWSPWRERWVMIATRRGGESSHLGDIYYAEAPKPEGPWPKAVRIVRHRKYSFYNPVHHDFFDQEGGRVIYFEGTYTAAFSAAKSPTPRYDYNQVLYRLDLADPRLDPARR